MVQDYSNINFSVNGMKSFFKDQGVEVSAGDSKKLESIFQECDTQNAKGGKGADGVLTDKERESFMDKVKSACPKKNKKVVDFFVMVDVVEDMKVLRQATNDVINKQNAEEDARGNDSDFMN